MEGRVRRIWGGDNFEFGTSEELHYLVLRGVSCPKPGQDFYTESTRCLSAMTRGKPVRIEVFDRDEMMREVADVTVFTDKPAPKDRVDVSLRLIELGMGWYNGTEFEKAAAYQAAEKIAREEKVGLWSQPDPIPPWEFQSH